MVTGLNYFLPAENPGWIAEQSEAVVQNMMGFKGRR